MTTNSSCNLLFMISWTTSTSKRPPSDGSWTAGNTQPRRSRPSIASLASTAATSPRTNSSGSTSTNFVSRWVALSVDVLEKISSSYRCWFQFWKIRILPKVTAVWVRVTRSFHETKVTSNAFFSVFFNGTRKCISSYSFWSSSLEFYTKLAERSLQRVSDLLFS